MPDCLERLPTRACRAACLAAGAARCAWPPNASSPRCSTNPRSIARSAGPRGSCPNASAPSTSTGCTPTWASSCRSSSRCFSAATSRPASASSIRSRAAARRSSNARPSGPTSVAVDISAFNVLLGRVKSAVFPTPSSLSVTCARRSRGSMSSSRPGSPRGGRRRLPEERLPERLVRAARAGPSSASTARCSAGYESSELMSVVLSRAARSARLTTHFALDFSAAHPARCVPVRQAQPRLRDRPGRPTSSCAATASRHGRPGQESTALLRTGARGRGDPRRRARGGSSPPACDGLITSPPYPRGRIDYHEQHRYAYELLGLPDRRAAEIGAAAAGTGASAPSRATWPTWRRSSRTPALASCSAARSS